MIKQSFEEDFGKIYTSIKGYTDDEGHTKLPLAVRILFPIISPIYYILGTSTLIFLLFKYENLICDGTFFLRIIF